MSEARVRAAFRQQGERCERLGSPFMVQLMVGLADALDRSARTDARVLDRPGQPDALRSALPQWWRLCVTMTGSCHGSIFIRKPMRWRGRVCWR
jgi:hypothetical protein